MFEGSPAAFFSVAFSILLGLCGGVEAAVIKAQSASRADVGAAVASAADGDTVVVPAGTAEWDTTLVVTNAITIQGAGIGATILRDNVAGPGKTTSSILNLSTAAGKLYRVTGIEFTQGTRTKKLNKGLLRIEGTSHSVRIDHCRFATAYNRGITTQDWALGVIDHCVFDMERPCLHFSALTWGGYRQGSGSWAANHSMGGADAFYVEDCTFANPSGRIVAAVDSEGGARWVMRHNVLSRGKIVTHGPEGGVDQGTRQFEIYDNDFGNGQNFANAIHIRSGSGVIFNNTATNYHHFCTLNCYGARTDWYYWGIADGKRGWDDNLPGGPFASGTHTGGNNSTSMTDSTKTWRTDQWKGYSIHNTRTGRSSVVISNNANTVLEWPEASQEPTQGGGLMMRFNTGDTYEFWKVVNAMNMPGMGKGALLEPKPAPPRLNKQIIEGIYAWNNKMENADAKIVCPKYPFIVEGVHFFNNTAKPGYKPYTYPHPLVSGAASDPPDAIRGPNSTRH